MFYPKAIYHVFNYLRKEKELITTSDLESVQLPLTKKTNKQAYPDVVLEDGTHIDWKGGKSGKPMFNSTPPGNSTYYIARQVTDYKKKTNEKKVVLVNGSFFNQLSPKQLYRKSVMNVLQALGIEVDIPEDFDDSIIGKSYDIDGMTSRLRMMSEAKKGVFDLVENYTISLIVPCFANNIEPAFDDMVSNLEIHPSTLDIKSIPHYTNYKCLIFSEKIYE